MSAIAREVQTSAIGPLFAAAACLVASLAPGCTGGAGTSGGDGGPDDPPHDCTAVKYYVDFDGGDDANPGTSAPAAWKHHPGDASAQGTAKDTVLQPGDAVAFRGGVHYRSSITLNSSGTSGSPIVMTGNCWEAEKGDAILDGSEPLQGWTRCDSADECGGNTSWESIYYAYVPADVTVTTFTANLHENDEFLWLAQEPDLPDPFYRDQIRYYYTLPIGVMQATSLADAAHLGQSADPDYWRDSSVMLWIQPNIVVTREIETFDPATGTITYGDVGGGGVYTDRETYYSLINSIHALDQAGEYYFHPVAELDGTHKVYLWPRDAGDLEQAITVSVRNYAVDVADRSHVTIEGFRVQQYSGGGLTDCGIGNVTAAWKSREHVVVRDNEIRHDAHATEGYGGIYLANCSSCTVEDNLIEENVLTTGFFITGSDNAVARGNVVRRPGHTGVWFFGDTNSQIVNNTVSDVHGTHGNGITIYLSCNNILVAWNKLVSAGSGFTFQDSANLYFYRNLVDAEDGESNVNDWAGTAPVESGTILFLNNTFVRNSRNASLNIGGTTGDSYVAVNNIIDGGAVDSGIQRSHNLYVGLEWNQSATYGWSLADGEVVQTDLSQLFVDPDNGDFHLKSGSQAIGMGLDPASYLPAGAFPDVDLWKDIEGNPVSRSNRDVGAYVSK